MTCPREQEALSGAPSGLEHAAACAACAESIRLLSEARAALSAGRAELTPAARARMWRNIELAEMQPRFGFAGFVPAALAAAAAVAIILLIFRPAEPPLTETEEWVVSAGEVSREGRAVVSAAAATLSRHGATLEMLPSSRITLAPSELMLTSGALEIQLARDIELSVVTTEVRVFSLGGSFAVRVDGRGTIVAVKEGGAEVNGVAVRAGEELRVDRPAVAAKAENAPVAREDTPLIARKEAPPKEAETAQPAIDPISGTPKTAAGDESDEPGRSSRPALGAPKTAAGDESDEPGRSSRPALATPRTAAGDKSDEPALGTPRTAAGDKSDEPALGTPKTAAGDKSDEPALGTPKTATGDKSDEPGREEAPPVARAPEHDPSPELDALARRADALRKNGARPEAIAAYLALAHRDDAEAYAEEALYRAAKILAELGRDGEARRHLQEAGARFPNGALAPERTALEESLR